MQPHVSEHTAKTHRSTTIQPQQDAGSTRVVRFDTVRQQRTHKSAVPNSTTGFTLIELLVTMAILTVITSIVLINHNRFSGNILLGNLAYDIALSIRQAQVYGLSVREFEGSFEGYGVRFENGLNTSYILFVDTNANNKYEQSELIELFTIRRGNIISKFCAKLPSGVEKCSDAPNINDLEIFFRRPNPDAIITSNLGDDIYETARITVRSPQGRTRDIFIASTGQISVQQEAVVTEL